MPPIVHLDVVKSAQAIVDGMTMRGPAGGLGRGLSSILTGTAHARSRPSTLRERFIAEGLDSLTSFGPLELCGYLHDADGDADLTMRSPDPGSLHPTEAYQLMVALRDVPSDQPGRHDLAVGQHRAMAVVVPGPERTGGVFFFGDSGLDDHLIEQLAAFAAAYAPVILEHDRPAGTDETVEVVVEHDADGVRVEARIGDVVGSAADARTDVAAAGAVIDALAPGARLIEVREVLGDERSGALVVALAEGGHTVMGAATVVDSIDAAAALAAVRAARRMP